jgi:alkanesulfonate monooxygenase SsuD/methylene tetrahydromethanopterin reductase-like flavin-dependent oxidoreductase (luciferase family)
MEFRLVLGYHWYGTYAGVLESALAAEAAGFTGLFRGDHLLSVDGDAERPVTEAWATLAGLARDTTTIRFGTLVSPATFRHPALLVRTVATIHEMSGGRVELGLGAGWHDPEHDPLGIPLPPVRDRFDRLEEQLAIVRGLWADAPFSFDGRHHRLVDARVPGTYAGGDRPRLIIGGTGLPRTIRLTVEYADELNLDQLEPDACAEAFGRLDAALDASGRARDSVARSNAISWLAGDPDEQRARIDAFAAAGVERLYMKRRPGGTVAEIEAFGREFLGA